LKKANTTIACGKKKQQDRSTLSSTVEPWCSNQKVNTAIAVPILGSGDGHAKPVVVCGVTGACYIIS
jgi:uncharacterized protein YaaQ